MRVKFCFPYRMIHSTQQDTCFEAASNECKFLHCLSDQWAIFDCGHQMPLALFFKICQIADTKSNGKRIKYPNNLEDNFERLWSTKGKKGSKSKAREKFKTFLKDASEEICDKFTAKLCKDIVNRSNELGMDERHLITYLNGEYWEQ